MLNLHQLRVLLAQRALELLALVSMDADVDERGEPVAGRAGVVLDHVRIDVDDRLVAAVAFDPERRNEIGPRDDRRPEREDAAALGLAAALEDTPGPVHDVGRGLAGHLLEFRIRIDDPLGIGGPRDDDRDRDLVEKMPELVAFERTRQIGGGEQSSDLVVSARLVAAVFGRHGSSLPVSPAAGHKDRTDERRFRRRTCELAGPSAPKRRHDANAQWPGQALSAMRPAERLGRPAGPAETVRASNDRQRVNSVPQPARTMKNFRSGP